jgi:hypothetical protein
LFEICRLLKHVNSGKKMPLSAAGDTSPLMKRDYSPARFRQTNKQMSQESNKSHPSTPTPNNEVCFAEET